MCHESSKEDRVLSGRMDFDKALEMEEWKAEMERRCNRVYFRNNSLLSLKGEKGRSGCLSYPVCVQRWWKEEQQKEL